MHKEKIYRQNDMECRPYMASIKGIKEIEADEWERLLMEITQGDSQAAQKARHRLITGCLPMVVRLATRYDSLEARGVKRIDLIGAGNLKLAEVVTRLKEDPGVALEAYLVTWIKKGIREACNTYSGYVQLTIGSNDKDDPDDGEITCPKVCCRSLDATLGDASETTLADTIDDDTEADAEANRASAQERLMQLLNRWFCYEEAGILYDTCLSTHPLTMKQCMQKYGLTLKQVRNVREHAINRLQSSGKWNTVIGLLSECR
jgi:RNA polymerase sigma factor (sigma-70 family)